MAKKLVKTGQLFTFLTIVKRHILARPIMLQLKYNGPQKLDH